MKPIARQNCPAWAVPVDIRIVVAESMMKMNPQASDIVYALGAAAGPYAAELTWPSGSNAALMATSARLGRHDTQKHIGDHDGA